MLLNYLKLSLRVLARNPFFTFINVTGLAIGFTAFFCLFEFAKSELKADQYHKDSERIARVGYNWRWSVDQGQTWGFMKFGGGLAYWFPEIADVYPEVESFVRLRTVGDFVFSRDIGDDPESFNEKKVAMADTNFFTFFTVPLIYGDAENVLKQPGSIVLSRATAEKYFGRENPVGQMIHLLNYDSSFQVSGVYQNLPHNTHLDFDLIIPENLNIYNVNPTGFYHTYVKLTHSDFGAFENKLNQRKKYFFDRYVNNRPYRDPDFYVQPLHEIAFSAFHSGDWFIPKSKLLLTTLALIGLAVIAMAWANYVNLSITRTKRRFKEIATRRVSGAKGVDMTIQFMVEAAMVNVMAITLALTLIQVIRTPLSTFFGIQVAALSSLSATSTIMLSSIAMVGILATGIYPAIISFGINPQDLFRKSSISGGRRMLPNILTTGQFIAAITFILLSSAIMWQIDYVLSVHPGFTREGVISIDAPVMKPDNYRQILGTLKKELARLPDVAKATASSHHIHEGRNLAIKKIGADNSTAVDAIEVDENFVTLFDLKMVAGRNFVEDDDPTAIIVSREAARKLAFRSVEDAVGSKVLAAPNAGSTFADVCTIVGVFENYRKASFLNGSNSQQTLEGRGTILLNEGKPLFSNYPPGAISVRLASGQPVGETIVKIEKVFTQHFPGSEFSWSFLSDKLATSYNQEKTARNQLILFTGLAIFIACLGLLGMITDKVVEKNKEIGIRKVLGAELGHIAQILLGNTTRQIAIASAIGIPIAFYLIQQYLMKFTERIELRWWHYVSPIAMLVIILLGTVASVLWKAAKSNPVEALKYE
ncbi:MAG TPA: ABC transporter permease [Chryseolinea sp.]|nr:ABC transporter permease [Chryseolinea sp.]